MRIEEAQKRRHSCWVKGYLRDKAGYGAYNRLMGDLKVHDSVKLKNHLRMEPAGFELVNAIVKTSSTSAIILFIKILFIQLLFIHDHSTPMTSVSVVSKLLIVIG